MQFIVKEMPVAIVVVLAVRRLLFSMLKLWLIALFVSVLTFFEKLFIFQRIFSRKLFYFSVFGNDLENELENVFWCLVYNFLKNISYII